MKTLADIPVLSGRTFSGHAAEFRRTRQNIFLRVARELGDIGQIRFFHFPLVVLTSPSLVHELLVERHKSLEKSLAIKMMFYPFAGKGLFTSEGESWKRQRKLLAPMFHPAAIKSYAPTVNAVITRCLDEWKDGSVIDAGKEMTRITMAVAAKVFFDADTLRETDELSAAVRVLFQYLSDMTGSFSIIARATIALGLMGLGPLPDRLEKARNAIMEGLHEPPPFPSEQSRRLKAAVHTLDTFLARMIAARRQNPGHQEDLLSRILAARDEDDGSFMNDRQVRDEIMTLFIAGHETTATATTWALYFLSRNPDATARWQAEIDALGGKTPDALDAAKLEWTRGVFREAMRIHPPAFAVDRVTTEDVVLGDYLIPAKTAVIVPVHALHRHAATWPDPERYDPSRFAPAEEAKRPRGAYVPFGAGPRICIGMTFAELEAELLLAQIAQRFELEPLDQRPIGPDYTSTIRPERPVELRVRVRKSPMKAVSEAASSPAL